MTTRSAAQPAAASRTGPSTDPVVRLPAALAQLIFLLLPAHDRMCCRAVSRGWRAALAYRGCWRILHFSGCHDLPRVRGQFDGVQRFILAASRAAGGAAEVIDARGVTSALVYTGYLVNVMYQAAEENGESLRVLRMSGTGDFIRAESVFSWVDSRKIPHLDELEADVEAHSVGEARRLLDDARQPDGRFKALRIRTLVLHADGSPDGVSATPEKQREVAESLAELLRTAAAGGRPSLLTGLRLQEMPLRHPGLIDTVADTVVSCGLESLELWGLHVDHTCLPAVSRALRSGHLRSLELHHGYYNLDFFGWTPDGLRGRLAEFCAAIRDSRLESLTLWGLWGFWSNPEHGCALLAALTAHPTLRKLDMSNNSSGYTPSKAAAAQAIAALLEVDAPALKELCIGGCDLAAEHLEPILGALRRNTHLTTLACAQNRRGVARTRRSRSGWCCRSCNPTRLCGHCGGTDGFAGRSGRRSTG